jgi:hypothetical protein
MLIEFLLQEFASLSVIYNRLQHNITSMVCLKLVIIEAVGMWCLSILQAVLQKLT